MSFDCEQNIGEASEFKALKSELSVWAKIKKFPLNATFELTPLCNLRCPMCYVRLDNCRMAQQNGRIHSAKEWVEFGRKSAEMGTLFVTLTGGEPLLHPEFWDIYNGLTEQGLLVSIYTNGCLIDEEAVEKFKANPPHNMKISIYGASDETYEKMCGVKDGFTRVSHAIDLLKETDLNFFCTTTVVRENMRDLGALYEFAYQKGIKYFHSMAVTLSARGAISDPLHSRTTVEEAGWTLKGLEQEKHPVDLRPFAHCGGYGTCYFMSWHWHMGFCGFADKPYAQVDETVDVSSAWVELLKLTDQITTPKECATCEDAEFCSRCPGQLCAESGDPGKVSETFCEKARKLHARYKELKALEAEKNAEQGPDGAAEEPKITG